MKQYKTERDGQLDFYSDYLKLIDKDLSLDDILNDNTDGVINGNILEFKLNINYTSTVLMQVIKYLSAMRIKGKSIPKNIILISLNEGLAYLYNSGDYLKEIEKVYIGSASKGNVPFIITDSIKILKYRENSLDEATLIELLRENKYTKINIDENCIVGWGERFYREVPNAKKSDFIGDLEGKVKIIGEIRKPDKFKEFINPYTEANNVKFQYLMDKLNDKMQKKNLGAFYTPELYVEKSMELLRMAIANVPIGNDYIILDRCAGTGNLEKLLTNEELSHCVLSTVEYYEYIEMDYLRKFELEAYNIIDNKLVYEGKLDVNKMNTLISAYYDRREDKNDILDGIACELNGEENTRSNVTATKRYNPNIVGYMVVKSSFDNPDLNSSLLTTTRYDGAGTYLRKDLFLQLLPVFSAGRYIKYNSKWTERGRIMKSADMKEKYVKDLIRNKLDNFLLKNLLFICFEPQNHCRTIEGSDGRFYRNELCLDITNGATVASKKLEYFNYNELEKKMLQVWNNIIRLARETKEYKPHYTYGLYQIDKELNTSYKDEKSKTSIYDYPQLNENISILKELVKEYYLSEILPTLFKYEFLK